mmetsp:Transcript_11080/g.29209  ORF Transcript_11080/g.29209 Transcript_11080/m.29209 type:complete len:208 (+) Transcript_11080:1-624(+)
MAVGCGGLRGGTEAQGGQKAAQGVEVDVAGGSGGGRWIHLPPRRAPPPASRLTPAGLSPASSPAHDHAALALPAWPARASPSSRRRSPAAGSRPASSSSSYPSSSASRGSSPSRTPSRGSTATATQQQPRWSNNNRRRTTRRRRRRRPGRIQPQEGPARRHDPLQLLPRRVSRAAHDRRRNRRGQARVHRRRSRSVGIPRRRRGDRR